MKLAEQPKNLLAGAMHCGPDDVRGRVAGKLDDVLGQIGLHTLYAGRCQGVREADLLAQHRFCAGDASGVRRPADLEHDSARLLRILGPMHLRTRRHGVALELF